MLPYSAPMWYVLNSDPDYLIKCAEIEIYHLGILSYFNFDTQFYRKLGGK